jgi:hypothetical protein
MLLFTIILLHHAMHSTVKAAVIDTIHFNALPGVSARQIRSLLQEDATKELAVYVEKSIATDVAVTSPGSTELSIMLDDRMLDDRDAVAIAGIQALTTIATTCVAAWYICLAGIIGVLAIVYSKYLFLYLLLWCVINIKVHPILCIYLHSNLRFSGYLCALKQQPVLSVRDLQARRPDEKKSPRAVGWP